MRLWKFAQRSMQSFLTSHGVRFTVENQDGTQVISVDEDNDDDDSQEGESSSRALEGMMTVI